MCKIVFHSLLSAAAAADDDDDCLSFVEELENLIVVGCFDL